MPIRHYLIYFVVVLLIAGCSTIRVSQDYDSDADFSTMRSFAWQQEEQPRTGDIRIDNSLTDGRIRRAVEQDLVEAGFSKSDKSGADFWVAYQFTIRQQIQSNDVDTAFGFGIGSGGHFGSIAFGTGTDVRSYDEGLLLIDVLDPMDGRLLWRGKGTDYVRFHADPEQTTRQINELVRKILAQFPPRHK